MTAAYKQEETQFTESQQKIMDNASKQLNEMLNQKFNNYNVRIVSENGRISLKIDTTDNEVQKQFSQALKESILKLNGAELIVASKALQKENCDKKELEGLLKNVPHNEKVARHIMNKSEISFTGSEQKDSDTEQQTGSSKKGNEFNAWSFTKEDWLEADKYIKQVELVNPKKLTEEKKKEIMKGMKDSVYEDQEKQKWIMLSVSSKTQGYFVKVPHNEEIEDIITTNIEKQLNEIKKNPDLFKDKLGEKNPFYLDAGGNLMVKYKNYKGKEENKKLMSKDGYVDKDVFKELMYVYNIVENEKSKAGKEFKKIRDTNSITIKNSNAIRDFLKKGFSKDDLEKLDEFYKPAVDAYNKEHKSKMTMNTFSLELGHYTAINEISQKDKNSLTKIMEEAQNKKG